jgi:AcrR family transcriptional regulator
MSHQRYISMPQCKVMVRLDTLTTRERILEATLEVLARSGSRRLSLSEVAATAGVSRPTLYRSFPSKEVLLEAFGVYEQQKYDAGIANAVAGLDGEARLDAILRFIVEFQHTYSLRRIVDVEPEHVVYHMTRVMPIMRERLLPHFPAPGGFIVANVVTRIALSHALIPDDDAELFYAELRHAAGLAQKHQSNPRRRQRPVRPTPGEKVR